MPRPPAHIIIRQYRVLAIAITIFFMILMWDMWEWFKGNHTEMSDWVNSSFVAMALAVIAAIKYVLENVTKRQEKDDEE